jgi:hypothetical protein
MVCQSVSGLGEKMMRRSNKPERDLTRKGIPLLLMAPQGCLTCAAVGSAHESSAKPVLFG